MLDESKLDSLDTRLEQFKRNNSNTQNELQDVLKGYSRLLEDYRALKGATSLDAGKVHNAILSPTPRNPYLLVLVDGNRYIFNEELLRDKEEGGMRAARMLQDAVDNYMREFLPRAQGARIVTRVFADLTSLSIRLAKAKLTGNEKRSVSSFTAGFTRAINFSDFIDTLDEEGTRFKIRESFKLAVEDPACSHILYAACSDNSYLGQLVSYSGCRDKISLVQSSSFDPSFHQFGLNVAQFSNIFRSSDLPTGPSGKSSLSNDHQNNSNNGISSKNIHAGISLASDNWREKGHTVSHASLDDEWKVVNKAKTQLCRYFPKGTCHQGDKCSFKHGPNDVGVHSPEQTQSRSTTIQDRSNISGLLPTVAIPGFIPTNKDGQRIDIYIPQPTQQEWATYSEHFHQNKPCNNLYLKGFCSNNLSCVYDHSPISPLIKHVLEYVVKCSPCPQKEACRSATCILGHMCQKNDCFGSAKGCRMKPAQHNIDPKLASMVPAEDDPFD